MRSRTKMFPAAAAALLSVGASVTPALASDAAPLATADSSASAEQTPGNTQDGMAGMDRMHEQMMQGMPDMAGMEEMMQGVPGMAKMHEQMMSDRPADRTSSAQTQEQTMQSAPGMDKMHAQMMQGMPDMAGMQEMMQSVPGMAKMHEQMMSDRPADRTSSAQTHDNEEA